MNPVRMAGALLRRTGLLEEGDPFVRAATEFRLRCWRWPVRSTAGGARIGIVVTPWLRTATPFFALECARELAAQGVAPVLLWDEADVFGNAPEGSEVEELRRVIHGLRTQFEVIDVAAALASGRADTAFLEQLLYENAVRELKGEADAAAYLRKNAHLSQAMRTHAQRVGGLLARGDFAWILVPGGVWAASGLWVHLAAEQGVAMTTFDCGPQLLVLGHGGPAAHYPDVVTALQILQADLDPAGRARLVARARAALEKRRRSEDDFQLQPAHAEAPARRFDLLVTLNYRSDTAGLHRQRAFASVTDWLGQLLTWVSARADVSVAIRQHPCERIPAYRGTDQWLEVLAPFQAQLGERLCFIAAEDAVNTYDLLEGARVMLPWTSRTGVEAAMLGKPVLLGTQCYYMGCGFTEDAATPAEYFAALERILAGPNASRAEAQEQAALLYYMIEECLLLRTSFTPLPDDFQQWIKLPPVKLWEQPANRILREALLTRTPVVLLQHREQEAAR